MSWEGRDPQRDEDGPHFDERYDHRPPHPPVERVVEEAYLSELYGKADKLRDLLGGLVDLRAALTCMSLAELEAAIDDLIEKAKP